MTANDLFVWAVIIAGTIGTVWLVVANERARR